MKDIELIHREDVKNRRMKKYKNFDEIDRDLKYLRLKTKIELEELKLSINDTKESISEELAPRNLIAAAVGPLIKHTVVAGVINRFVKYRPLKNLVKRLF
jgi:hypothetical protein